MKHLLILVQWNLSFTTTIWFLQFWSLMTGGRKTQVHFNGKGYISPSNCGTNERWSYNSVVVSDRFYCRRIMIESLSYVCEPSIV